jgi:hypothetical protein
MAIEPLRDVEVKRAGLANSSGVDPGELNRDELEKRAAEGDSVAMVALAASLRKGHPAKSDRWLDRAAGAGNVQIMLSVALLTEHSDPDMRECVSLRRCTGAFHLYRHPRPP